MMSLSGAMSCWRYMPRFRRALCGPRVTVNPHVMRGPASSGQHVWIGRRARSASFPSHTTCWHGAPETSFGAMCITCLPIGIQRSSTSRNPLGGSGSLRNARSFPTSRSVSRGSTPISPPMARATRRVVPNRLPSTGITWPLGFSNSRAGPPALSTRSQTSVISSFGSTSARTLLSSPARSSSDRKSRRSRYLICLSDRCSLGEISGPWNSAPNLEVGKNSDKKDRADPVVLVKSLEAGFSVATADEAIVMGHDRGRSGETQIVDETQPAVQADDCEQRERHAVADHYRKHIVSAEGDRGRFDADTQIVVAIHHSIFRIVGDRPEDVGKEQPPAFGRDGLERQIVDETQPAVQADDCEQRERHAVADHYRKHIVSAEGDRGRFDADTQIVVAIHHSIFRIVGDRPEDVGKEQPPAFGRDGLEDCGVPHRNAEPERDSKIGLGNRQESFGQGIGRREAKRGK